MSEHSTDCRSEAGITVGLIDGIIFACRVLRTRDLTDPAVVAALKDAAQDRDVHAVLGIGRNHLFERREQIIDAGQRRGFRTQEEAAELARLKEEISLLPVGGVSAETQAAVDFVRESAETIRRSLAP